MTYRGELNPELKSINLSLKLMNGVFARPTPYFQKSISSLQELSNRIKIANHNYNFGRSERESAREWYSDRGVNFSSIKEIAREVRKYQRVQEISKVQSATWESLEYEGFDDLPIEDFLHQNEERVALYAVMNSFSTNKASNHMDNLRANYVNSLTGKKTEKTKTGGESTQDDGKQLVSQFIRNYKLTVNQTGLLDAPVHKIVESAVCMEKSMWLSLLYHQVELIEYLGRKQLGKRNQILIISLKQLEKINAKRSVQPIQFTKQFWKTNYERYRNGSIDFEPSSNDADNQLIDDLITIQQKINSFQEIDLDSTTDLKRNDSLFLRRLKLIALGKYEQDAFENDLISQAWMLILTSGLRRKQVDEKEQRSKFRKLVWSFARKISTKDIQNNQQLEELLASLISLGAFQQILDIYEGLKESRKLTHYYRAIFINLFIVLAFNVELIEQFCLSPVSNVNSRETKSILEVIIVEIALFAEDYKRTNEEYSIFVTLIASILCNLEQFKDPEFQPLPQMVAKVLRMSVNDFFAKDCTDLPYIAAESKLVRKMIENILVNARVQSDDDYMNLEDLCKRFEVPKRLRQVILQRAGPQEVSQSFSQPFGVQIKRPKVR